MVLRVRLDCAMMIRFGGLQRRYRYKEQSIVVIASTTVIAIARRRLDIVAVAQPVGVKRFGAIIQMIAGRYGIIVGIYGQFASTSSSCGRRVVGGQRGRRYGLLLVVNVLGRLFHVMKLEC